jgi:hypothetical protein
MALECDTIKMLIRLRMPEYFVTIRETEPEACKMRVSLLLFLVVAVTLSSGTFAQDTKVDDVIKVDTQLVDVPVAVSSPDGLPLRGLKASNFVIYEDGKRQEIADFSSTAEPFEVALLLDTSGSARNDLQLIKRRDRFLCDPAGRDVGICRE